MTQQQLSADDDDAVTEWEWQRRVTLRGLVEALYRVEGIENRTIPIEQLAIRIWAALPETAGEPRV